MVPGKGDDDVQFNPLYAVDPEAPSPGAGDNASPSNEAIGVHREGLQESSIELSGIVSADPDGRKNGASGAHLAPAASISGSEQLRTPLSGARPLSAHPGRPLTPEQREIIQQSLSGIRENLAEMGPNGTLRGTETVSGTVHNLRSMLEQMNDQEREISHILHERGFTPLPELQLVEVPPGLPEEQEEMYLTRSIMKLEEQLEEIERRLTFDERGEISADAHLYKPSLAWHPMDDEEDEGLEISEVGAYMQQYRGMTKQKEVKEQEEYEEYRPRVGVSFLGLAMNLLYLCACGFYTYVRIWYSLTPLGKYMAYGIVILVVEWLGMISVIMFTVTLLFRVRPEPESEDAQAYKRDYHIRVLVPCYKESLAIIKQTILAARGAEIPPGCKKTIYLCDDGKDVRKREWILAMDDPHVVYVTGRKRPKGETNGKSNNLNNCLKLIYPKGIAIGYGEVMCLFDADQVCSRSFFLKMLPLIDSGDNVAISLSPQCVYNIKAGQDIFNRSNVQFWEVMLPGYDAIGFISCTGTNMLIRCRALQECGWFPNTTVTEDWELGMWMKKYGWVCRYLQEYLAVGEAPLEVRNAFQQRSRWCKGHFQTFFSRACPATDRKLSTFMRIMYSGTVISYLSSGISVPLFSLVPILAILFGVFPLALNLWTVIGITVFYGSTMIVLYNSTNVRRLMALYFVQVSNYILWWTYLKAATLTPIKIAMGKGFSFKVTNKGASSGFDLPVRDLFVPTVFTFFSLFAFSMGLANLDVNINAPTALSICWCFWNALPGILLLSYTFFGQGRTMRTLCSTVFVLSFLVSTIAILLIWWLYPREYDTKDLLRKSLQFLDAQRSGVYGNLEKPDWRDDTLMYLPVDVRRSIYDLTGGFYNGGVGGNSKLASTVAFSTTMLSWAVLSFPDSFNKANTMEKALKHINAGAMYLMRSHVYNATDPGQTLFFPNTGNLTTEWKAWEQPEALSARLLEVREKYGIGAERALYPIPSFTAQEANQTRHRLLNGAGVADLAAQMSAALTAASLAISSDRSLQENGRLFLSRGSQLFSLSLQFPGVYTQMPNIMWDYQNVYMSSSSYRDDQAWAGAWLYKAMKMSGQVTSGQLSDWLERVNQLYGYAYTEWNDVGLYVTRDRMLRATTIMLAIETRIGLYDADAKSFLEKYICANDPIDVTPKDRLIHPKAPTLGDTALLSFLMAQYAEREPDSLSKKHAHVYLCKAMSQLRYMVGDRGKGFVVGFGRNPPKNPQQAASSCGAYPNACNSAEIYSVVDNINPLNGALVKGPTTKTDSYKDVRTSEANQVSLDNNAALPGLVAAISDADKFWMECLLDGGIFSKHPLC